MKRTAATVSALFILGGCLQFAQRVELRPDVREAIREVQTPATVRMERRLEELARPRPVLMRAPDLPQVEIPVKDITIGPEVPRLTPDLPPPPPPPGSIVIGPEVAYLGGSPVRGPPPGVQVPAVISAFPWVLLPDTAVGDSLAIPRAFGGGGGSLDSIRKEVILGNANLNVWKVTEKVGDYDTGSLPAGQECNRHIPGTFAWAIDQVAANPDDLNYIHFTSIHYIRCNDILDNMPGMFHFVINGTTAPGGVMFNTPRLRFNTASRDCVISNLTFRLSLTGTMTNEQLGQCVYHQISASWANGSGSGGQYTGFGSQTGSTSGTNPQSHISNQLGLYAEGDEDGPRLFAVGGGSPRMDCMVGSVGVTHHMGWRNFSSLGGRQPLIGCVGSPESVDPSINNNGALVAQSIAWSVVDRGPLIQQEVLLDFIANWMVARPGAQKDLGRDTRVIAQAGCSNAGGDSPVNDSLCSQSIYGSNNRYTDPEQPQDIQYGANDDAQWTGTDTLFVCRVNSSNFGDLIGVVDSTGLGNYCPRDGERVAQEIRRHNPQSNALVGGDDYFWPDTTVMDSTRWENDMLRLVGDMYAVAHDGVPFVRRDAIDTEQIEWFRNHVYQTGGDVGYPVGVLGVDILGNRQVVRPLPSGNQTIHVKNDLFLPRDTSAYQACEDNDGDGICKVYEDARAFLSDADATDRSQDTDGDGWTDYEEYTRGTDPATYGGHENPLLDPALMPPPTYASPNDRRVYIYHLTTTITTGPGTQVDTVRGAHPDSLVWISARRAQSSFAINRFQGLMVSYDSIDQATGIRQLTEAQVDSVCSINNCPPDMSSAPAGR